MLRVGKFVIGRLDVAGGSFTYGNRIALGEIFRDEDRSSYRKMKDAFIELYGWSPLLIPLRRRVRVMTKMLEDIKGWLDRERQLLTFEPEPDQITAGIHELAKAVGDMGTVKAIAKAYSQDPDAVLKWEYAKVFGILFTDLEEHKYEKRYNKVIDEKLNRKYPRRRA